MLLDNLKSRGVLVYHSLLPKDIAESYYQEILLSIQQYASELNCDTDLYLSSVGRWGNSSSLVQLANEVITPQIQTTLEHDLGQTLQLEKANIICKTRHAPYAIPCHQDISYQTLKTYDFSVWLALTNITDNDGPLMCLPGSHLGSIEPAPDFWAPNFQDKLQDSKQWQTNAESYLLNTGDAVLFDCATWHASKSATSGKNRFAFVTRWTVKGDTRQYQIPPKERADFGMWTCHEVTRAYCKKLLMQNNISPEEDFIRLIEQVLSILPQLDWIDDLTDVKLALGRVKTLHLASKLHDAGDASGRIYANLWSKLLYYVNTELA